MTGYYERETIAMLLRAVSSLLALALSGSQVSAQTGVAPVSPANMSSEIAQANARTRTLLQAKMAEQGIPALQVAVIVRDRVVLSDAFGTANIEQGIAASRKTLFPINSATKSFTGVAVLQLVEAGKVDLEAPIGRYLEGLPTAWQAVRVRQLLAHTSGLPDIVDEHGLIGGGTDAEAWAKVQTLPMAGTTGAGFAYNQTNYVLLGRLIEKLGGQPLEQLLRERQFAPAAMAAARFGDGYDIVPGRASVYIHRDTEAEKARLYHWIDTIPVSTRAGAGLYTTADYLAQWILALQGGRLLKPASVVRMWQADRLNDGKVNSWAMGWPILGGTQRRAVGGIGGGRSTFFVYPDDGVAVIVMTNMVGANPQSLIDTIAGYYIDPLAK